jgi:hypothetical protein
MATNSSSISSSISDGTTNESTTTLITSSTTQKQHNPPLPLPLHVLQEDIDIDNGNDIYSILVISTIRIINIESIDREINYIRSDAHELYKIHKEATATKTMNADLSSASTTTTTTRTKTKNLPPLPPRWQIRVVATTQDLLDVVQKQLNTTGPLFQLYDIHFDFQLNTERFNKYIWIHENLHLMNNSDSYSNSNSTNQKTQQYTKIIMKDSDQRISGIPIKTMIRQTENSIISSPLRERKIDSLKENRFHASIGALIPFLQAKSWMGGRWYQRYKKK